MCHVGVKNRTLPEHPDTSRLIFGYFFVGTLPYSHEAGCHLKVMEEPIPQRA